MKLLIVQFSPFSPLFQYFLSLSLCPMINSLLCSLTPFIYVFLQAERPT
jgi:hypothetical protein